MNPIFGFGLVCVGLASVFACWLGWQLLRQNGRMLLRLEALEHRLEKAHDDIQDGTGLLIGSPAPEYELPDLVGNRKTLAGFLGRPLLLIFFDPACGFSRDLAQGLASRLSDGRTPRVPESLQLVSVASVGPG